MAPTLGPARGAVASGRVPQPFSGYQTSRQRIRCVALSMSHEQCYVASNIKLDRRLLIAGAATFGVFGARKDVLAFTLPPPGFRVHTDRLDGYSFVYPSDWTPVTSSGNDIFLRNPFDLDENLFVDISSPSSSRYLEISDLGRPEEAAKQLLDQYLNKEFMSTRLGVRREGSILSATSRAGSDGKTYYDVAIRMTSFASRNPYVATQAELMSEYGLEWDRVFLTTLGVANKRLYELRVQSSVEAYDKDENGISKIRDSFTCKEVEV